MLDDIWVMPVAAAIKPNVQTGHFLDEKLFKINLKIRIHIIIQKIYMIKN